MANLADCEKLVIQRLISVFSTALNCDSTGYNESEIILVEKVLQVLLSQNESLYSNEEGSNNREVMRSMSEIVESSKRGENSTNVESTYGDSGTPTSAFPGADTVGSIGTNKLHQLEIIKVFVLIFVISIILLTTCRMVFQLFIRFRPEKPPLA